MTTLDGINWLACWVSLGIGVGIGMAITSIFSGSRE